MASYSSNGAIHGSGNHTNQDPNAHTAPEYNLSGVLHFLQSEWRRYEHDRNTWAIERAELRARIALLEGERRSVENLKTDLLRRIKMLELALRQERMKSAPNGSTSATGAATNKMLERFASTSHSEDPSDNTKLLPRATTPQNNAVKLPMGVKDAKGRAKSREFLQQCLQEIAYLTSNATLNPITHTADPADADSASHPPRPQFHVLPPSTPAQEETLASNQTSGINAEATKQATSKDTGSSVPPVPSSQPPTASTGDVIPISHSGENPVVQQPDNVPDVQLWHPHGSYSSHLDAVRALVYDGSGEGLFTASDDCTIKYWRMLPTATSQGDQCKSVAELLTTLRGHQAAVTCLAYSKTHNVLYSGSLDAGVRKWNIPSVTPTKGEPVSSCQSTLLRGTDQAVWGLTLFPSNGQEDMLLVSVSASGKIQLWNTNEKESQPLLSWDYFGTEPPPEAEEERKSLAAVPVPTSVTKCPANLRVCVVSFTNGAVKLFNLADGKVQMTFKPSDSHAQANMVVGHPTLPLVATAYEDNYIHVYDIRANACVLSLNAHRDSVSCLDIDPSGLTFASGSYNGTVRFWDLMKMEDVASSVPTYQAKCFQEVQAHEAEAKEGVLAVAFHPSSPLVATSGADGTVRMYG